MNNLNNLNILNDEDIEYIFTYISLNDIIHLGLTCKRFLPLSERYLSIKIKEIKNMFKDNHYLTLFTDIELLERIYFLNNNIYYLSNISIDYDYENFKLSISNSMNNITLYLFRRRYYDTNNINNPIYDYNSDYISDSDEYDDSDEYYNSYEDDSDIWSGGVLIKYHKTNNKIKRTEEWYKFGNKVIVIKWYINNKLFEKKWFNETGELDRINKPAYMSWYDNGKKKRECWYIDNNLHRDNDKPASIYWYDNGKKERECWYIDGKLNRDDDKPASIYWDDNGKKEREYWYLDNNLHRDGDKLTCIRFYNNGNMKDATWFINGTMNRKSGPSHIKYFKNGKQKKDKKIDISLFNI